MFNLLFQSSALFSAKVAVSTLLFGASSILTNPGTTGKPLSFEASVYVTPANKIRVAVEKTVPGLVSVALLNQDKQSLFQQTLGKKDLKTAMQLDVSDLPDGAYTLEIKSAEGRIVKQINLATPQPTRSIAMQQ